MDTNVDALVYESFQKSRAVGIITAGQVSLCPGSRASTVRRGLMWRWVLQIISRVLLMCQCWHGISCSGILISWKIMTWHLILWVFISLNADVAINSVKTLFCGDADVVPNSAEAPTWLYLVECIYWEVADLTLTSVESLFRCHWRGTRFHGVFISRGCWVGTHFRGVANVTPSFFFFFFWVKWKSQR